VKIDCLSIFPEMIRDCLQYGVLGKAFERGLVDIDHHDIRAFTTDKHNRVDDVPYGGGAGMVFKPEPVVRALRHVTQPPCLVIHPAPAAPRFDQSVALELSEKLQSGTQLVFIASRYEGLDHRVVSQFVNREYALGDFIISGGEMAIAMMIDAILRFVPDVLGNPESHQTESFHDHLLEHPHYTRPPVFEGQGVPEVLQQGHHEHIRKWRKRESIKRTFMYRPDLLALAELDKEGRTMLAAIREETHGAEE